MVTHIIIRATHTQEVLGEQGVRIRGLTSLIQKRFKFPRTRFPFMLPRSRRSILVNLLRISSILLHATFFPFKSDSNSLRTQSPFMLPRSRIVSFLLSLNANLSDTNFSMRISSIQTPQRSSCNTSLLWCVKIHHGERCKGL